MESFSKLLMRLCIILIGKIVKRKYFFGNNSQIITFIPVYGLKALALYFQYDVNMYDGKDIFNSFFLKIIFIMLYVTVCNKFKNNNISS